MNLRRIQNMEINDRPREKLIRQGSENLSDTELVAILLGKGTKDCDVLSLAKKIIPVIDKSLTPINIEKLVKTKGIGNAKATLIAASIEFARRRIKPEGTQILQPYEVFPVIKHYADSKQEHFICIALNGAKEIICKKVISIGLVDKTLVHPREVFSDPIKNFASAVIIAHNHPQGCLLPSDNDIEATLRLIFAGEVLGIKVLDHLIFNNRDYYSFLERNEFISEILKL